MFLLICDLLVKSEGRSFKDELDLFVLDPHSLCKPFKSLFMEMTQVFEAISG